MAGAYGTRISIYGTAAGTTFINTIYTENEVPTEDWPSLATKADYDWVRKVNIYQSTVVTWHTVQISYTRVGGPQSQSFPINRPGAGSGLLPMQLALVIKLQTGFSGRSYQGRWFISGLNTGSNNLGMPSSTLLSGFATQAAAILAAWTSANTLGGRICLYSRKLVELIPLTGLIMSNAFGTCRSRKFGRGI